MFVFCLIIGLIADVLLVHAGGTGKYSSASALLGGALIGVLIVLAGKH